MPADGFTKHLFRQKHETFLKQLNLVDVIDRLTKWSDIQLHDRYEAERVCWTDGDIRAIMWFFLY